MHNATDTESDTQIHDFSNDALSAAYISQLPGSFLECVPAIPQLDFSFVPIYEGSDLIDSSTQRDPLRRSEVALRLPMSEYEFEGGWINSLCAEVSGYTVRLSDDLVLRLLPVLVAAIYAQRLDPCRFFAADVFAAVEDEEEPYTVIEAVLKRFSTTRIERMYPLSQFYYSSYLMSIYSVLFA